MTVVTTPSSPAGVFPHAYPMLPPPPRPLRSLALVRRPPRLACPRPPLARRPSGPFAGRCRRPTRPHSFVGLLRPNRFARPSARPLADGRPLRTPPGTPFPRPMVPRCPRIRTAPLVAWRRRTLAFLLVRLPRPPRLAARRVQPAGAGLGPAAGGEHRSPRRPGRHQRRGPCRPPPRGQRSRPAAPPG